jgi:hypothetical protein
MGICIYLKRFDDAPQLRRDDLKGRPFDERAENGDVASEISALSLQRQILQKFI